MGCASPRLRAGLRAVLLLFLGALLATDAPAADDPVRAAYDQVLAARKAGKAEETVALSTAFLAAHPDYRFAHSALYMQAGALFDLRRFPEAAAACERYAKEHGGKEYADRLAVLRGRAFFKARRAAAAREAFDAFVAAKPGTKEAAEARRWRGRIDPRDVKVEGAVVLDYAGKYREDPRFAARVREVVRLVPVALATLRTRLGLGRVPAPGFRVRFADAGNDRSGIHMSTDEELHGERIVHALTIRAEPLVLETYDLERTLVHELLHVLHREGLSEAYYLVPKWVREGMAVWTARQGPDRLPVVYASVAAGVDGDPVARVVDGLDGKHGLDDYGEDYLAFAWFERTKGLPATQALVRALLTAPDPKVVLEEASGMPFPDWKAAVRADATAIVSKELVGRERYVEGKRLLLAGKAAEAAKVLAAVAAETPPNPLASRARFDLALAHERSGALDRALEALDACEAKDPHGLTRDDAARARVRITALRGDAEGAVRLAKAFLRDFSWAPQKAVEEVQGILARDGAPPVPESPKAAEGRKPAPDPQSLPDPNEPGPAKPSDPPNGDEGS